MASRTKLIRKKNQVWNILDKWLSRYKAKAGIEKKIELGFLGKTIGLKIVCELAHTGVCAYK